MNDELKQGSLKMEEVQALSQQMSDVREDVREIRAGMAQVAEAITRLAVLEDRNVASMQRIASLEERQRDVEKKNAETNLAMVKLLAQMDGASRTIKVMWAVVGAAAAGVFTKAILPLLGS